jgi:hypothetical protein
MILRDGGREKEWGISERNKEIEVKEIDIRR